MDWGLAPGAGFFAAAAAAAAAQAEAAASEVETERRWKTAGREALRRSKERRSAKGGRSRSDAALPR